MNLTFESEQAEQICSEWSKFGVSGANLEWVEQIWSEWSKFGVGGANLEWVEQIWIGWSRSGQNRMESSCEI